MDTSIQDRPTIPLHEVGAGNVFMYPDNPSEAFMVIEPPSGWTIEDFEIVTVNTRSGQAKNIQYDVLVMKMYAVVNVYFPLL